MRINNFLHKGLKRLYENDSAKGVPAATADKLRDMLYTLERMRSPEQLRTLAAWKAHTLTGGRKGTWSLSVTRNFRLTFSVDEDEAAVFDVDLEDDH